jgi:VanZ family protein
MKWLTGGFILLLILIVLIANLGLGPVYFPFVYDFPGLDKIGHFLLMGTLSFLVNTTLGAKKIRILSANLLLGNLLVILVVVLEEISQIFLVHRAFSLLDLAFDMGGIILGGYIAQRSATVTDDP